MSAAEVAISGARERGESTACSNITVPGGAAITGPRLPRKIALRSRRAVTDPSDSVIPSNRNVAVPELAGGVRCVATAGAAGIAAALGVRFTMHMRKPS